MQDISGTHFVLSGTADLPSPPTRAVARIRGDGVGLIESWSDCHSRPWSLRGDVMSLRANVFGGLVPHRLGSWVSLIPRPPFRQLVSTDGKEKMHTTSRPVARRMEIESVPGPAPRDPPPALGASSLLSHLELLQPGIPHTVSPAITTTQKKTTGRLTPAPPDHWPTCGAQAAQTNPEPRPLCLDNTQTPPGASGSPQSRSR